ncbi:MAG: hypothetical protein J6J43_01145 [Oscillospiraceae bacterium]|nr:hypothetical protein [Oscillospiraceae bacterium]
MFRPEKWVKSQVEPWEQQPASAGLALKVGTAVKLDGGVLAVCNGEDKPGFICMADVTAEKDGQMVPVERVREETVYETELSVASASIKRGEKYTIDEGGEKLTATAGGSAEVVDFDGTKAGDKVRVRFV